MSAEIIIAGVAVFGVVLTGGGLIMTWRKNGRELRDRDLDMARKQAERDTAINATQKNILAKLEDGETGLTAINKKVGDIKTNCASVTANYGARITAAERGIDEIKQERPARPRRTG